MRVTPARVAQTNRGTTDIGAEQRSQPIIFPAPVSGLVTTTDVASQQPGSASVLNNWLPTLVGARLRGGSVRQGKTEASLPLSSAFKYNFAGAERLFMASVNAIYDMSAPAPPPATTGPVVDGLSGGDWCTFQHTNDGASYLVCLNGVDTRRLFNGSVWSTTPAITFPDSTTMANLSYGWIFKGRQFLIKAGSLDAYYLETLDAVGGDAEVFPMAGRFKKGGTLLTGFTWAIESGDGPNEYCCFVTSEGEVAVYSGSDPGADFSIIGVYQIGKPLGKNSWLKFGGDVLVATVDGLFALSIVFNRPSVELTLNALSRPIDSEWRYAANLTGAGWTMTLWSEENLVFVSFPEVSGMSSTSFVFHTQTKKWSFVSGWPALCFATFQKGIYFGGAQGYAWQGDYTGSDDGYPFPASYLSSFNPVGGFGQKKIASLARMRLKAAQKPAVRLFARADMDTSVPPFATVSQTINNTSLWDVGKWDEAVWDGGSNVKEIYSYRQNVRAEGEMLALGVVLLSGGAIKLNVELDIGSLQVTSGLASS